MDVGAALLGSPWFGAASNRPRLADTLADGSADRLTLNRSVVRVRTAI